MRYAPATNVATFSFIGGVSLPDGNYFATLPAGSVQTPQGGVLGSDTVVNFFILAGDSDHDRDVDVNDLGILASNWQQSPRTFAQGDFDYSGKVDVNDLGILASHWQVALAPSAPFSTSSSTSKSIRRVLTELLA